MTKSLGAILLVEDDEAFADVIGRALTNRNFKVSHAKNNNEASSKTLELLASWEQKNPEEAHAKPAQLRHLGRVRGDARGKFLLVKT